MPAISLVRMIPRVGRNSALIVVDVQKDFCPGGTLAVPGGDEIVPVLNQYLDLFRARGASIVATRDWHPPNHMSFKPQGGIWPPHCVQDRPGAEFHRNLKLGKEVHTVSKADKPDQEAYSGFQGTDLANWLRAKGITSVFVCGLATDYCVKSTALDAREEGFEAYFLEDASRGVEVNSGDSQRAIAEMKKHGVKNANLVELRAQALKI